jgi:hypothetical protein
VGNSFSFSPAIDALDQLSSALELFYTDVSVGKVSPSATNAIIRQLARILVPLDHSQEPRFMHDPALPRTAIPALSMANSFSSLSKEDRKFAAVELTRKQNRVVNAIYSATKLVKDGATSI